MAGLEVKAARSLLADVNDLASLISEVEDDHKGVPVLLRQYLKLGGKLLAFNVDADFCNALDGLMVVDLTRTKARIMARYMGREETRAFRAHHGLEDRGPAGH